MENAKRCCSCKLEIQCRSQNPNQKYCAKKVCQNARKRLWKARRRQGPDYRETERAAQKAWREKNPSYMANYRRNNPEYVARNRQQQGARNARRRSNGGTAECTQTRQAGTNPAHRGASGFDDQSGIVIVNGDASNSLVAKDFLNKVAATRDAWIVNGDGSDPCVPMFLVSLSTLAEIVKETPSTK
jgi:hypothetical protein